MKKFVGLGLVFAIAAVMLFLQGCMTFGPVSSVRMNGFTTINTNEFGVVYLEQCVADTSGNPVIIRIIVDQIGGSK